MSPLSLVSWLESLGLGRQSKWLSETSPQKTKPGACPAEPPRGEVQWISRVCDKHRSAGPAREAFISADKSVNWPKVLLTLAGLTHAPKAPWQSAGLRLLG